MKHRNDAGFSLVEVLVSITILAAVVLPVCSALLMAVRMNERTDELMHAQLAVSSAVETLMAEGIPGDPDDGEYDAGNRFPAVKITISATEQKDDGTTAALPYYNVTVASTDGLVTVRTVVNAVPDDGTPTDPETDPSAEPPGEGAES